jgi:Tol biopolymer transport system component
LDGSSEALVLAAPAEFFGVQEFLLSPDGTRVFYRGDDEVAGRGSQLYVVPVDGSLAPRRLDLDRVANSYGVRSFSIAPDGRHLVYALGSEGLFSVQLDPLRAPKRLHNPLSAAAEAQDHAITSDSRRVVYLGHGRVAGRYRLYSAPIDGRRPPHADVNGTPEVDPDQLTPMPHFGDVNRSQPFSLTADGQYAVYVADARVDGFQELFRVRTDGTTAPDLLSRDGDEIVQFAISADDAHVVYRSYSPSGTGIYRTPLAGGEPVKFDIDPPAAPEAFQVAPDDSFVFFSASSNAPGRRELMAVPFDASRPARSMGASFPADWRLLFGFQALPGGRALFRLNEPFEVFELYEAFAGRTRPAPR